MTITTRSKAHQIREEEFARLRNIEIQGTPVHMAASANGLGVHKRWIYPETPAGRTLLDEQPSCSSTSSWGSECQHARDEPYRAPTPYWVETVETGMGYSTPSTSSGVSSLETPPPAPRTPARSFSAGVVADMDIILRVHVKKNEDIGEAVWRHVEMYVEESRRRQLENHRRAYELVRARPHLLREVGADTELFIRECSSWDANPFQ